LRHVADALAELGRVAPTIVAEDSGRAAIRAEKASENLDGGALTGAVLAQQGEDRAWRNLQIQPVYGQLAAEGFREVVNLDGGVHETPMFSFRVVSCFSWISTKNTKQHERND